MFHRARAAPLLSLGFALAIVLASHGDARASDTPDPGMRGRTTDYSDADSLLTVPRALLYPFYLASEYLIRRPFYALATWVEDDHIVARVQRFFHPTPDFRWYPVVWAELGVAASVGEVFEWKNLFMNGDQVHLSAATGGLYFWEFSASDKIAVGPAFVGVRGQFVTRSDRQYYGLGPRSDTTKTYFRQSRFDAFAFATLGNTRHLTIELANGIRTERSGQPFHYSPSISTVFDTHNVPGFGEPVDLAMTSATVTVDSRKSFDQPSGAYAKANVAYARDLNRPTRVFVSTELDARVSMEVARPDRVLTLRGYAMDTIPLDRDPVPFTDQAMLGWDNHLGFQWGRFRDEAAAMLEISYRYPIAYFLDAALIASAGNVFSHTFSDFNVGDLTGSGAIALRTRRWGPAPLEISFGAGTTRFDQSFAFDTFRLTLQTAVAP